MIKKGAFILAAGALASYLLVSKTGRRFTVGPTGDGGFISVLGWKIKPAGTQIPVDTLPMASVVAPDGKSLLVLNGGYNPPSVSVIDLATLRETGRVKVKDAWLGLAMSGDSLFVGGGSQHCVYELKYAAGKLRLERSIALPDGNFIGDLAISGGVLYAASLYRDRVFAINLATSTMAQQFATGRRPYRLLLDPDGKSLWVSNWADANVTRYSLAEGKLMDTVKTGDHPTDMIWGSGEKLYVANANTNTVSVIHGGKVAETINLAMTPRMPPGMTPSGLALSAKRDRLYVACSDANVVAVVDLEKRTRVAGFIPAGWYPTAVQELPDHRLVVLNGRGLRSHPNPQGPNPMRVQTKSTEGIRSDQYVGRIQTGTVSVIDALTPASLDGYTKQAMANTPYRDRQLDAKSAFPPIRHVVYIIKENRTYDQVFGGVKEGNGDPSLVLFGENVTPNHHKLAREFVLLDNFYVNADVSADGHNWSMAAIAPDAVQKTWPNRYGGRGPGFTFPYQDPSANPPAGYIWNRVAEAGKSIRNYGYLGINGTSPAPGGTHVTDVKDPVLKPVTNLRYRAYDLDYPDVERAKVFLADLETMDKMADFTLMRLGNDHTFGAAAGKPTPFASVADNDLALGRIIEGLTKSKFWPRMAIFILEDDSQAGPDHVDSHRSPAFVISPYVRRGSVDSSFYNTTSMLRSMELMLGAKPMTVFDASSPVMYSLFQSKPDLRPYAHEAARVPLTDKNPRNTTAAARSKKLDFDEADLNDDDEMNDILWLAIRGTDPPAPVRSFFGR